MDARRLTPQDLLISSLGQALRTLAAESVAARPSPAAGKPAPTLNEQESRHSAGLMRVNHSGEVAAQALYRGQSLTARNPRTQAMLLDAAREEEDHLAWCEQRLKELGAGPSKLNPLWYAGSFAIGVAAGIVGDRVSLGFVGETERQVEGHLDEHLAKLPQADVRSREIVTAMKADEIRHGANAMSAGGAELPPVIRSMMKLTARIMTRSAYWL